MNLLAILGVGATLWQIMKPKDPVDKITDHAILLTGQLVSQGVPIAEAAKSGVAMAVDQHFAATGPTYWQVTATEPWAGGKTGSGQYVTQQEADAAAAKFVSSGYLNVKVVDLRTVMTTLPNVPHA